MCGTWHGTCGVGAETTSAVVIWPSDCPGDQPCRVLLPAGELLGLSLAQPGDLDAARGHSPRPKDGLS